MCIMYIVFAVGPLICKVCAVAAQEILLQHLVALDVMGTISTLEQATIDLFRLSV